MGSGEVCDDGGDSPTCDGDCSAVSCGDNYTNAVAGESCDAGGVATPTCDTDCIPASCGDSSIDLATKERHYLGESLVVPCPYCEGDNTFGDGVRDGTCLGGENAGESCDVTEVHSTFPAPGGGGTSLDCLPLSGRNVSGLGIYVAQTLSTGSQSIGSNIPDCGFPQFGLTFDCHCGVCSGDLLIGCASDDDCLSQGAGTCGYNGVSGLPLPNQRLGADFDLGCVNTGGITGQCSEPVITTYCDGIVRASGEGFITCSSDLDCAPHIIGVDAGDCTIVEDARSASRQQSKSPEFQARYHRC